MSMVVYSVHAIYTNSTSLAGSLLVVEIQTWGFLRRRGGGGTF
jgi:hypothetical protein